MHPAIIARRRRGGGNISAGGFVPEFYLGMDKGRYIVNGASVASFSDAVTFSRSGSATYVDSTGTFQTAADGEPRIGHHVWDGSQWVNKGLLLESEARTQLLHTTDALVTQSHTVTAEPHTLHFTGTGTVTLSGASTDGPLVGTGDGEQNRVSLTFTPSAGSLTLTVSGDVNDAQLEVGSTPSSYIPNLAASGTVTRAAETLTAPSANLPWPEPVVIGEELVTNGTDWTGASGNTPPNGWTKAGDLTQYSVISGALEVDRNGDSGANTSQSFLTTPGSVYVITFDVLDDGDGNVAFYEGANLIYNQPEIGTKTLYFVASGETTTIGFRPSSFTSQTIQIDNISVREINPLAVSIAMEGGETFADLDTAGQVALYDRRVDANNRITLTLDTDGAKTGTFTLTLVNGGSTETISTTGEITPDVNEPFNVAFVATSNELGIALNGTAETRVSHSIGLPDLSGANATYEGMGTRAVVREWADDITNAGMEAATS